MCSLDSLKINLKGLDKAQTAFEFKLTDDYFAHIDAGEVSGGDVDVRLVVSKSTEHYYKLDFAINGNVTIPCSRCLDDMTQPIETEAHLVAKLGEENSDDDEIVAVDENEGMLDTAWFIYESIVLAIPIKHVHAPGKCNRAMIELIEEHCATRSGEEHGGQPMDPRWSGLEKIKNNIIKD